MHVFGKRKVLDSKFLRFTRMIHYVTSDTPQATNLIIYKNNEKHISYILTKLLLKNVFGTYNFWIIFFYLFWAII